MKQAAFSALWPPPGRRTAFLLNALLTAAIVAVLVLAAWGLLSFFFFDAVNPDGGVAACRSAPGACWPFIAAKAEQFLFGQYPESQRWRALAAMLAPPLLAGAVIAFRRWSGLNGIAAGAAIGLVIAFGLMDGQIFGLPLVKTEVWGGLTLTLLISYTGFAASLPLGIALALMRRSSWPVPRWLAIIFIEFWRGVPLVTVLFMASFMLPLFLPDGVTVAKLARALVAISVFASAYMAEVVRGGLQSVGENQASQAEALGFTYAQSLRYVLVPQALRNALPGIAGTFIGLLKDTTLVLVIGLFDFLGAIQLATADPAWSAPSTTITAYAFAALLFWCLCFSLSRAAASIEARAADGQTDMKVGKGYGS